MVAATQWAAQITSIPAEKIIQLARETLGETGLHFAVVHRPQRRTHVCATARAIAGVKPVLTGNVGINGGTLACAKYPIWAFKFAYAGEPGKTQISVLYPTDANDAARNDRHTRRRAGKDKLDVPINAVVLRRNTLINQHGDIAHPRGASGRQ